MLGDALTKDKADPADLLRASVRASAYQLVDESCTLQRAREEREAGTFLEGITDVIPTESTVTAARGRVRVTFPPPPSPPQSSDPTSLVEADKDEAVSAARGEHRQCSHDDFGSPGRPSVSDTGGLGQRLREMDAWRTEYGLEEAVLNYRSALARNMFSGPTRARTVSAQTHKGTMRQSFSVAEFARTKLAIFPREQSGLLSLLSLEARLEKASGLEQQLER